MNEYREGELIMKIFKMNDVKFSLINNVWQVFMEELVIGNPKYSMTLIPDDEDEAILYIQNTKNNSAKSIRVKVI